MPFCIVRRERIEGTRDVTSCADRGTLPQRLPGAEGRGRLGKRRLAGPVRNPSEGSPCHGVSSVVMLPSGQRSTETQKARVLTELIIILALIVANGVFAGAEIAIVSVRKAPLQGKAEQGHRGARAVLALRAEPERFLATVQVGITVVGATAAAFGGASMADHIAPAFERVAWIGEHAEPVALALVIAGVSFLTIVVGELVPKSLALRGAERFALLFGRPLLALSWLARPLIWILSSSANVLLRPFGDRTTFTETRYSAEELQQLVDEAAQAGTIHPSAGEIASRALELPHLTAADVMVPRQNVVVIPRGATLEQLRRTLLEHTHSRLPVYDGVIDNVVGYVAVKDLLAQSLEQQPIVVEEVMRPPFFVPEVKGAVELLHEMRSEQVPFAIVVDEQGGTSGIVTIEDLLEELVGEIFSEHVKRPPDAIRTEEDGSVLVSGVTPVRDVNRALGIGLPEDGPWTTIAGQCLAVAGRIPRVGDMFEPSSGIKLEIVEASPRRVGSVRIHIAAADDARKDLDTTGSSTS